MATVAGVVVANTAVAQTVPVVTVTANAERVYERETATFTIRMDPAPTKQTRVKYIVADRYDAVGNSREGHKSVTFQPNQATQTISIPTQELVYTYNVQGAGQGGLPKQVPCQRPGGELPDVPSEKPASGLWSSLTAEQFNTLRDVCNALRLGATMGEVSVVIALPGDSGGYTRGSPRTAYTDVRDKSLKSSDPKPPPVVSIAAGSGVVEGGDAVFTVTADPAPSSALTVDVTVSQSGDYGVSTGSRQVTVSTSGSGTLTVSTTGDSADEVDGSVTAVVDGGTGYTVSSTKGSATVAVADDDDPPVVVPDVSFGSSVYSGGEGSGSRSVSVGLVLSAAAPSGGLAVSYQVGGSAVAGSDYSSLSGSVTFVQGSSSAAIAVSVTDDAVDDDAETIVLTLVDGAAYDLGTPSSTTITIADDDDPPVVVPDVSFGSSVYSGGEGSGSRSVSVGLVLSAAAPSGGLAVSYQVGGSAVAGSDYSSLSGSVTFVQGSSSAAIAVSVTDDAVDDDAETIVLTLVDGAAYDLGTPSSTTITIADDDELPP